MGEMIKERMINVDLTPNKSKKYLLPLLSEFINLDSEMIKYLINTYIYDNELKHKNCIYLLFDYAIRNSKFSMLEYKISQLDEYEATYDLENNMVLYVIKFPKVYISEYNHFKNGKYSEFEDDAQILIKQFLINQGVSSNFINNINDIFKKDKNLRKNIELRLNVILDEDTELEDIMNDKNETININKYINKYI